MYSYKTFRLSTLTMWLTLSLSLVGTTMNAQCHDLIGSDDVATSTPVWYSCDTGEFSLNIATSDLWTGLTVDWGDGSDSESFAFWSPVEDLSHTYPEEYAEYTIVFTSIEGCSIAGEFIKRAPLSTNLSGPEHVCQGFPATLIHDETEADSYLWNFSGGQGTWYPGAAPNLNLTFNDSGTYEVYGIVSIDGLPTSCSDTTSFEVSVTPIPEAIILLSEEVGCGTLITEAEELSGDGIEYEWTFNTSPFSYSGSTTPEIIFENPGMYVIQLEVTDELGCINNATKLATVFESPNVEFSVDSVCEGNVSSFTNLSILSENESTIDFTWSFGDGDISDEQNPQHTYSTPGEYEVSLEMSNTNCTNIISHTALVAATPEISASSDITSGCAPFTVNFESTSDENSTITWDFGDDQSSNNSNEEHTYINENIDPNGTTFIISATATNLTGCVAMDILEVSALKGAVASVTSSDNGCAPLNTTFTNNSENATDYSWNFSDGDVSNDFEPVHTFENTSEDLTSYSVEFIAIAENGCNDSTTIVINAFPELIIDISLSQNEGCSPFEVQTPFIENASQITWSFGDDSNDANTQMVSHVYSNVSNNTQIFTLSAIGVSEYGCVGEYSSLINVNPQPIAQFVIDLSEGCSPLVVNIVDNSSQADLNWSYGDGVNATGFNGEMHQYSFQNLGEETITQEISLTVIGEGGCVDTQSLEIDIFPEVISQFSTTQGSCSPFNATFTNESSENQTYSWEFGDGEISEDENPTHIFTNPSSIEDADYDVTLTVTSEMGCSNISTEVITALATPAADITLSQSEGCGSFYSIAEAMSGEGYNYQWTFNMAPYTHNGITTPELLFNSPGTYELQLEVTAASGCSVENSESVNVFEIPTVNFSVEDVCHGSPSEFTDLTTINGADEIVEWIWGFGNGEMSNDQSPNYIYNTAGLYNVELEIITNFCSAIFNATTYVEELPEMIASSDITGGCSPVIVNFAAQMNDDSSISWNFGDNQSSNNSNEEHTYVNENVDANGTIFVVTATATSPMGCVVVDTLEISALKGVIASITSSGNGCAPLNTTFTNDSENASYYSWNFSDGDVSSDFEPVHTFENTSENLASYSAELIAISENGCNDSTSVVITASPELIIDISLAQNEGCSPFEVQTPFIENASQITWSFGDDSNDSNTQMVSHVYSNESNNALIFTLSVIGVSEYGCVATDTLEVSALKGAVASVASSGNGCAPLNTTFTNTSENASDYSWDFSDGDVSSDFEPVHTFDNTSENLETFSIELIAIAENGCNDTTVVHVTVYPEMVAQFNSPQASCTPFEVVFTNESSGNATFEWTFGDGDLSTELNPIHIFDNENTGDDETFSVELTATSEYGCSNTATSEIAVFATPVVSFHVTPITQTFPNTTVAIENLSTSGSSSSVLWNFGDGNVGTNENPGEHTYDTWGVFSISVIISNEYCSDDGIETINILSPTPELAFTGRGEGCAPFTVDFTNLSLYANNYHWDFGDGTTVFSENATHSFNEAGTYNITLKAFSYEGVLVEETQYASVTVFPRAQSDFSLFPTEVFAPGEPIQFYNLSTDADEFVWYFGNGETSSDENPTYEYTNAGNYNVTLTANNEWGCSNTFSYENAVTALDGGLLVFPTAFTPVSGGGNGGTYDLQGYNNDVFRPLHGGVLDFEVFVFNKYGEQIFYSSDINIGWDGYVNGVLATQDVYAYKAIATLSDGTFVEKAGTVTLISK